MMAQWRWIFGWLGLLAGVAAPCADARNALEPGVVKHLDEARRLQTEGKQREAEVHAQVIALVEPIRLLKPGTAFDAQIERAAQTWNRVLGVAAFALVDRDDAHDIVFRFVPDLKQGNSEIAGFTDWSRQVWFGSECGCRIQGLVKARTQLPDGRAMSCDAMNQILLHELGHVIGLADGADGIMGPLDPDHPVLEPTSEEVRALKLLIGEARRIRSASPSHEPQRD